MSSITYNPNSASIALSSTKLDNVIKPMCLSKAEAKEARVQAKEARVQERVQAKEARVQERVQAKEARVQAKEAKVQASLLAKEAKVQASLLAKEAKVQASLLAKEAKIQERLLAKEAKVQARVQASLLAKEAKVQARLLKRVQTREAKLQARLLKRVLAREAINQVREAKLQARLLKRVLAREAIKQAREAIKQVRVAEREALRKRKERVKEIKRLYKIQARRTENILIMQRFAETRRLALEASAQLLLEERDMRRARRENGMDSSWVRDSDGNWVIRQNPVPVPVHARPQARPQARPPRINPVRSYANQRGPARHQRVNARRMTAVNPVQELINKDKIECNKPHAELITKGTAIEVKDCPICLDELGNTNQMVLRCGHSFCGDCIMEHMPRVGGLKCPVCRAQYGVRINGWVPPTK
jgi:hypothetical protein